MRLRHLRLVRAGSAAGLFSLMTLGTGLAPGVAVAGEPAEPLPVAEAQAETVKVLDAQKSGDLSIEVRGSGQSQVKLAIKNASARRLNVILPAGLVAASATGQGAAGGGGGGLQSMGLGAVGNRAGGFGQFANNAPNAPGLRSVGVTADAAPASIVVPAGKSVEVELPAVCLNFGLASPTAKDRLKLVDVDDYSRDPRVRKALRSVATLGTSQGTAQAVMWHVCNNVPFATMVAQGEKVVNRHEVALASRFLEALDASGSAELVDAAYLSEARVFLTVVGGEGLDKDAHRLGREMEGLRVLGLPVRITSTKELPRATAPALHLLVDLAATRPGETAGKIVVRHAAGLGSDSEWVALGQATFRETSVASALKGVDLAHAVDHAVAAAFVAAKPARKAVGSTTMRIDNRLPFTLASVTLKAGGSAGSPPVTFGGLGIGPARSGFAALQAPTGTVDRVELNGL